jgi:23S rRNA (cytosine1962-C5)-methyltransferase
VNVVRLALRPGLARHLRVGHPWVYKKGLEQVPRIPAGSVVDLTDGGKFVARGYFDPKSPIAVRVLTRDVRERIDQAFLEGRLARALELRRSLLDLSSTDAFRWVHGEGDGLPGVVVDVYAGLAVVKLYSAGLTPYRAMLTAALRATWPELLGVLGRDRGADAEGPEDDSERGGGELLWGSAPEEVTIHEKGVRFRVDPWRGQKTGFFLDQRENRALVRRVSAGARVLNCFSFSGGFSVNAALGGASRVFSVDQDADAIALARANFRENGLDAEAHDFLAADVFRLLPSLQREGRQFDLVILDPPAFAKSQRAVEAALDGYASVNRQALVLVRPGGLLATASCSARVSGEAFLGALREAAASARVDLSLVEERYQPPDHPVPLAFPEGRYLKFHLLRVHPW